MTIAATTEPTIAEQLLALETTAHRLATERDQTRAEHVDLLEANCQLQQELNRASREALLQERIANSLRADLDTLTADNRRLSQRCRDLAVANGVFEQQDARRQDTPQPDDRKPRRLFRRTGNAS